MESFAKILELLSRSIQSLRWPALVVVVCGAYFKYAPSAYQPFVSSEFLNKERLDWLGVLVVVSTIVFVFGWFAAGIDTIIEKRAETLGQTKSNLAMRTQRHAQERLQRMKEEQIIKELSINQRAMLRAFAAEPDALRKIRNDHELDLATLLTAKGCLSRMRPYYDDFGKAIGEVYVLRDWIRKRVAADPAFLR